MRSYDDYNYKIPKYELEQMERDYGIREDEEDEEEEEERKQSFEDEYDNIKYDEWRDEQNGY